MTWTVNSSGTQTCVVGTPATLATLTSSGVYQLWFDLINLAGGDIFQVWATYAIDGTNARRFLLGTYGPEPQLLPGKVTTPVPVSSNSLAFVLEQIAGTSRTVPWQLLQQSISWTVDSSGSVTPTVGTPSTLYTESSAGTIAVWVDTVNMVGGDQTFIYPQYKVDGSTARSFLESSFSNVQANPGKLLPAFPVYTNGAPIVLNQTAGTARAYPYQILRY